MGCHVHHGVFFSLLLVGPGGGHWVEAAWGTFLNSALVSFPCLDRFFAPNWYVDLFSASLLDVRPELLALVVEDPGPQSPFFG